MAAPRNGQLGHKGDPAQYTLVVREYPDKGPALSSSLMNWGGLSLWGEKGSRGDFRDRGVGREFFFFVSRYIVGSLVSTIMLILWYCPSKNSHGHLAKS